MGVTSFNNIFQGRKVLLTGHTGFKGSWLALWLHRLGANVCGVALAPETAPNHWDILGLNIDSRILDIRDSASLYRVLKAEQPDLLLHLAAQPLVRRSYLDPLHTWTTNVMGTANLLEAVRHAGSVSAVVVVTTDKCYENREWEWGYRENDRLGGHDPYSASKAATELLVESFRQSYFSGTDSSLVATARAGNVIGGGDWSADRLIPDAIRSIETGTALVIRSPSATRPWQHVLDSLSGYLLLSAELLRGNKEAASAWNFGPDCYGNRTVEWVLKQLQIHWPKLDWSVQDNTALHEAKLLQLDSSKARQRLGWQPVWDASQALKETADWYRTYYESGEAISVNQLKRFVSDFDGLLG